VTVARGLVAPIVLVLAVLAPALARANDEVEPDRPDVTNSAKTVPAGGFQLETGLEYGHTRLGGHGTERRFAVQTTGRAGLTDRLEARIEGEPLVRLRNDERETDVGEVVLGLKYRFLDAAGSRPALGVLPFVKLPLAQPPIGSGRPDFGLVALASFDLPADVGLDVNAGGVAIGQRDPDGYLAQALASASLSVELGKRIVPFAEVFFASRDERDGRDTVGLAAGVIVRLAKWVAADAAVVTSLLGRAPDWALRGGMTMRFGP
jgi:hypothetical protein